LASGATVQQSQDLVVDLATPVTAHTPGCSAVAYRPANQASLQAFLDQYLPQRTGVRIETSVPLNDISGGADPAAAVDVQANGESGLSYMGTRYVNLPNYVPGRFIR